MITERSRASPVSPAASSEMLTVHVPFGFSPSNALKACSGVKTPVYGGPSGGAPLFAMLWIELTPLSSSRTVLQK